MVILFRFICSHYNKYIGYFFYSVPVQYDFLQPFRSSVKILFKL